MRRTKEDTAATREALLDAAETVFLRVGVARATLEAISREAGMTRGALYWHFANKEAIYAAMLERVRLPLLETELMSAETFDDPLRVLRDFADQVLLRIASCEHVWRVHVILLLRRERLPPDAGLDDLELQMRRNMRDLITRAFQRAAESGQLRSDIAPELAAIAFQSQIMGLLYLGVQEPGAFHLHRDGIRVVDNFLDGYRAG